MLALYISELVRKQYLCHVSRETKEGLRPNRDRSERDIVMALHVETPAIEMKHVTKSYGKVKALNDISFVVEQGEVVAFLGPNGAGKSTSIALMLGVRRPSSGSVALFGENPRIANHRKRIGVMLQASGVPATLKVRELVELFGRFHDYSMQTRDAITMAGLSGKANMQMGRLSGGQKQRLYFALALVGNPDVLFLDEPTVGLDVEARRSFWETIHQQIDQGKTIMLTTHNLEEADAIANRIVVINRGEIIADGSPISIKQQVGGKHVSFRAEQLTEEEVQHLPNVQNVSLRRNRWDLYTMQPELLLATLFQNGTPISDLEVIGAGLEEAFIALTSPRETSMQI
jgi:ABC-2 type transport system ATP-binding protein